MSAKLPSIDPLAIMAIAKRASRAILDIYFTEFEVTQKDDLSPLTKADNASNDIIVQGLGQLFPHIPIVSEESDQTAFEKRKQWSLVWIVDPLDGTKEFIQRNGEFTINMALVSHGIPIWGMIYIPVSGDAYYASRGDGAKRMSKGMEEPVSAIEPKDHLIIASSRSHWSPQLEKYVMHLRSRFQRIDFISAGSALKFCLIAEGRAHLYLRFGTTMEWDTAAGQIIVEEAGGQVCSMQAMEPLVYNKEDLSNPSFVAMGSDLRSYLPIL